MEEESEPLSREILIAQGSCCGNGCRNCPYEPKHAKGARMVRKES